MLRHRHEIEIEPLREWATLIQGLVVTVGQTFTEPDDDWLAMCFVCDTEGATTMLGLEPSCFAPEHKEAFYPWLSGRLREMGADRVALLVSTWYVDAPASVTNAQEASAWRQELPESLGDAPGSREALVLTWADISGEFQAMAEIERHPDGPPTLAGWSERHTFEGPLADTIRRAVQP